MFIDFQKAFDSIEWSFIVNVLHKLNFGVNFINWIKILYKNPEFVVKNNGWLSKKCSMHRGIRQGCPVSSLLFVLVVEMLAEKIRQNPEIKGIQLGDKCHKIAQHADDTALTISDLASIDKALIELNLFGKVSGSKLNLNKTEGIWLGPFINNEPMYKGIEFKTCPIRYLGIYIGHDTEECKRLNWDTKLENLIKCLDMWKMRNLTIFGKVLIIKSLAMSKLIYNASILPVPDNFVNTVNKVLYNFLFNNHCRIKRNTLIGNLEDGGIKMIDVEASFKALKAAWVSRLLKDNLACSHVFNYYCMKLNLNSSYMLNTYFDNASSFPHLNVFPDFYKEVILSFNACKFKKSADKMSYNEFLMQPIWGNKMFKFENKCLYFKSWCKSNILHVKDICVNGTFISENNLLEKLEVKSDWIREYSIVKKVFRKLISNYGVNFTPRVNIKFKCKIVFQNKVYDVTDQKSRFYYNIIVNKKFIKPLAIAYWIHHFELNESEIRWKNICLRKVKYCCIYKIAEFNHKLLNNTLSCGFYVNKWNKNVPAKCLHCSLNHDVKHMLFDCSNVNFIWQKLSVSFNINFTWKKILFGFGNASKYAKSNVKLNNLVSLICFLFYKIWIQKGSQFTALNLKYFLLGELDFYNRIQTKCNIEFIELSQLTKVYDVVQNLFAI